LFKKKQVLSMVSIAVISFLIGTTLNVMATASNGNPWDNVWEAIFNLQARVTSLEESTNTKTWHLVTNFTLSYFEEPTSDIFFIQGETWRIKWEPQVPSSDLRFFVWDENGNVLDLVEAGALLIVHHDANGIHYMPYGEGSYYIETDSFSTMDFTIESYH
jgi:hypothetical protein